MNRSKGSKPYRKNSKAPTDKRPMDRMAMNRKVTRDVYAAREVEQAGPDRQQQRKDNQLKLDQAHSSYKQIVNGKVSPVG